jgi:hypothetical protein
MIQPRGDVGREIWVQILISLVWDCPREST